MVSHGSFRRQRREKAEGLTSNPTAAAAAYARFIERLGSADPEYQWLVREARQRQSRLTKLT